MSCLRVKGDGEESCPAAVIRVEGDETRDAAGVREIMHTSEPGDDSSHFDSDAEDEVCVETWLKQIGG